MSEVVSVRLFEADARGLADLAELTHAPSAAATFHAALSDALAAAVAAARANPAPRHGDTDVVTIAECAERIGVTAQCLKNHLTRGTLRTAGERPAVRGPRRMVPLVRVSEARAAIARRLRPSDTPGGRAFLYGGAT